MDGDAEEILAHGLDEHLTKPFKKPAILAEIAAPGPARHDAAGAGWRMATAVHPANAPAGGPAAPGAVDAQALRRNTGRSGVLMSGWNR